MGIKYSEKENTGLGHQKQLIEYINKIEILETGNDLGWCQKV